MIQYGDADVMVCGGAESTVTPLAVGGFCARHRPCPRATTIRPPPADPGTRIATASCWARAPACWCSRNTSTPRRAAPGSTAEVAGFGMSGDAYPHDGAAMTRRAARAAWSTPCRMPASIRTRCSTSMPTAPRRRWATRTKPRRSSWPSAMHAKKLVRQFHQVDDRPPAGRRRRPRVGVHRAGGASPDLAADHQHLQPGSGVRSGLLCRTRRGR